MSEQDERETEQAELREPVRLLRGESGASDTLRAALDAGRRELPSEAQLAGLAARLAPTIAATGAASGTGTGASASAGSLGAGWVTWVVACVGVAGVIAAVWMGAQLVTRGGGTDSGAASATDAAAASASATDAAAASATNSASASASATDSAVAVAVASASASDSGAASASASATDSGAASASASASDSGAANFDDRRRAPALPRRSDELDVDAELSLVREAQDALRANAAAALTIADEHARRFPRGTLAQEREVVAIEALVSLGRSADARRRAARFSTSWPRSAHARRIAVILGESTP